MKNSFSLLGTSHNDLLCVPPQASYVHHGPAGDRLELKKVGVRQVLVNVGNQLDIHVQNAICAFAVIIKLRFLCAISVLMINNFVVKKI